MKPWLCVLALAAFLASGLARGQASDPVRELERLVADASAATDGNTWVYQDGKTKEWRRAVVALTDVKYNVKRTESESAPAAGEVRFTVRTSLSAPGASEAASMQAPVAPYDTQAVTLFYSWERNAWRFTAGEAIRSFEDPRGAPKARAELTPVTIADAWPRPLRTWRR